jgi:hypothetical protein
MLKMQAVMVAEPVTIVVYKIRRNVGVPTAIHRELHISVSVVFWSKKPLFDDVTSLICSGGQCVSSTTTTSTTATTTMSNTPPPNIGSASITANIGSDSQTVSSSSNSPPQQTISTTIQNNDPRCHYQPASAWGSSVDGPRCISSPSLMSTTTFGSNVTFEFVGEYSTP